ncbi:unnamed protein product [Auanema sp. JU1783]|nr:unnamed protein product [Auanema sp. JU1783]
MGKIGTHNGKFHCDEALACFMLKNTKEFKDFEILRTRDPELLKTCDIVVDVGGIYDHDSKRYDHHQKEFTHTMQTLNILPFNSKLSSAGLVYAHYGKQLIQEFLGLEENDPKVNLYYERVYESFMEQIDAVDNGISQYDGTPRYRSSGGISGRVGRFNPHWNEENVDVDARFVKAMDCVGNELLDTISYLHNVWWPARELVEEAVKKRFEIDVSGRILCLDNGSTPWKEHFFTIESEQGLLNQNITYILFQDTTAKQWRIQAIPVNSLSTFENRLPLPQPWRSLRDDTLSEVSGIPGGVFVHTSGFIGGNKTREGVIEMARKALQFENKGNDSENGTDPKRTKLEESS